MKDAGDWATLLVVVLIVVMMLNGVFNIGSLVENNRLYKKCLVEQQDKSHKEAVELCRERTKE